MIKWKVSKTWIESHIKCKIIISAHFYLYKILNKYVNKIKVITKLYKHQ